MVRLRADCPACSLDSVVRVCYAVLVVDEGRIRNERDLAEKKMKACRSVTHDRREETMEAKARWFRSLPISERMDMFCFFTDLALTVNPALQERKHAQPVAGRIQVISAT